MMQFISNNLINRKRYNKNIPGKCNREEISIDDLIFGNTKENEPKKFKFAYESDKEKNHFNNNNKKNLLKTSKTKKNNSLKDIPKINLISSNEFKETSTLNLDTPKKRNKKIASMFQNNKGNLYSIQSNHTENNLKLTSFNKRNSILFEKKGSREKSDRSQKSVVLKKNIQRPSFIKNILKSDKNIFQEKLKNKIQMQTNLVNNPLQFFSGLFKDIKNNTKNEKVKEKENEKNINLKKYKDNMKSLDKIFDLISSKNNKNKL
jgi:hypothetical protein